MLSTKRSMFLTLLVLSLLCISTAEKRETPPTADALTQATPVRQLGHHPFWGGGYGYGYGYPFMYPSPFLFRPFFWGWNPYMYAPGPYWRRLEAPCLDPEVCPPAEAHTTSITPTTPPSVRQLGHRTRTHTHYYWPVTAQFMYGPYVHYFPHTWHFWGGHHHAHAHMHGRHLGEVNDTSTRVNETMPFNSLPFDEDIDAPMSYFDPETGKDMCVFVNATDTTDEKIDDGDTIDVEIVVLPCDEVKRLETAHAHNTTEDTETETASPGNNRRLGHRWYGGGVYYRPCCVGQYYYPVSMNYVYGVYTPFFPHTYGLWAHTYNRHHGWWRRLQETEAPKETETASPRTPAEMASPNITVPENVTKLIEKYEDLWFEMLTLQEQMSIATETLALSPIEETPFHVSNIQKIVKRMEETARALDKIDREIEKASPIPMHEPIKFVRDNVTYCLFMNVTHPDQDEMETREDSEDRDDMASSETHEQSEDQDQDDVDFAYSLVAMPCDHMKPLNRTEMETPTPEMASPVETETVSPPTTPTTTTPVSPETAVSVGGGGRRMLRKKIGKKKGGN